MIDTTREQDTVIEALATAWGAVAVEPVQPDATVRVIAAVPDVPTPLGVSYFSISSSAGRLIRASQRIVNSAP